MISFLRVMSVLKLQKNLTFGLGRVTGNFKCPISTLTGKEIVVKEWKGVLCSRFIEPGWSTPGFRRTHYNVRGPLKTVHKSGFLTFRITNLIYRF